MVFYFLYELNQYTVFKNLVRYLPVNKYIVYIKYAYYNNIICFY